MLMDNDEASVFLLSLFPILLLKIWLDFSCPAPPGAAGAAVLAHEGGR